jgi:hypothetical protein
MGYISISKNDLDQFKRENPLHWRQKTGSRLAFAYEKPHP